MREAPLAQQTAEGEMLVGFYDGGAEVVEDLDFGWGECAIVGADVVELAGEVPGDREIWTTCGL